MKKLMLTAALAIGASAAAFAGITIRYQNDDSKPLVLKFKMDGSDKEVTFEPSKTTSVTIQGSSTKVTIETPCGKIELKDGMHIRIKNGCIKED